MDAQDEAADDAEHREQSGSVRQALGSEMEEPINAPLRALIKTKRESQIPEVLKETGGPRLLMAAMTPDRLALCRKALEWVRQAQERKYGSNDSRLGNTLMRLGVLAAFARDKDKARELLKRGVDLQRATFEQLAKTKAEKLTDIDEYYLGLSSLCLSLELHGDYAEAEPWARLGRSIAIAQDDAGQKAEFEERLAELALLRGNPAGAAEEYKEARKTYASKAFGLPDNFSKLYSGMSTALLEAGEKDEALKAARYVWGLNDRYLKYLLTLPLNTAMQSLWLVDFYSLAVTLGQTDVLADKILRCKGCVLDAKFLARSLGAESRVLDFTSDLSRYETAESYLTLLEAGSPEEQQNMAGLLNERREEVKKLEAALTARGIKLRTPVPTADQVVAALGPRRALVELIRYHRYLGKGHSERAYGAMVFAQGQPPQWIHLGRALDIDDRVTMLQGILDDPSVADSAGLRKVLTELQGIVWQPVAALLPHEVSEVIISPDGQLSFLPFAALVQADGKFVAESWRISYVTSGRDLLRPSTKPGDGPFVLFGDPSFTLRKRGGPANNGLKALANSAAECKRIMEALAGKVTCLSLLRENATEEKLTNLRAPIGLHFATHGEFTGRRPVTDLASEVDNMPGQRSVIYLAGAQDTLDTRAKGAKQPLNVDEIKGDHADAIRLMLRLRAGVAPTEANDGIVTAQEISMFHLEGTRLVTLSACESGVGEARTGEGVLGLRRSFIEAGVQNLLVSLWRIPDDRTGDIMADFYASAFSGNDIAAAWADTQRTWFCKLRDAGDDDAFFTAVRTAGAFVLNRQGLPP